ncbi:MAG: KH domain-containing protein [Candidatus Aenigmatarchaeota archaeon]
MIEYIVLPEEKAKILKNKNEWIEKIKELSGCNIELNDQEVKIEGKDHFIVLRTKEVFRALARGFCLKDALVLLDQEYYLDVVDLKEWGKTRERRVQLKGRVIGKKGSFKKMLEEKTETKIIVEGKTISILGKWEGVNLARRAIEMLLEGKMHTTVQRFLEKQLLK